MMRLNFFVFCLLSSSLCVGQNQAAVDSLLQILETEIPDNSRVDIYLYIAQHYQGFDYNKHKDYSLKAYVLSEKANYTEGKIESFFRLGVNALNQEKNIEAEEAFTQMLSLAKKVNDSVSIVKAYRGLGKANRKMKKIDIAFRYFIESLEVSQNWEVNSEQAFNHNAIGLIYYEQENYDKALEYYLLSLNIFEQLDHKKGISIVYINLGTLHRDIKNFNKAIKFFNRSIEIEETLKRKIKISHGYFNLAQTYYQLEDYKNALEYYFESLKTHPKKIGRDQIIAKTYSNIALVYVKLNDYEKALEFNFKSLRIYENVSIDAGKPGVYYAIGRIYNIQNQTELARKYITEGIVFAQQEGLLNEIRLGADQLALIENKAGNYKNAYEASSLLARITDSLYSDDAIRKIATLEAQYQFRKEKDSLKLVRKQEMIIDKEKVKQKEGRILVVYMLIGLFVILGIACFIFVYKSVQRKKILSLRNRISRDLHDEIGSTLSSIALYGTVANANVVKNPQKTSELLTLINSYSSSTMESMNDIVWAINSDENTIRDLIGRMRSFSNELEDTNTWKIGIHYDEGIIERNLNMIQRRNMYLIFKEAINNALKYSKGKEIQIHIDITNNLMKLDIIDDGIGFELNNISDENNSYGGNGLKNMKKRAEELGGKLFINSLLGQGTTVCLEFNL